MKKIWSRKDKRKSLSTSQPLQTSPSRRLLMELTRTFQPPPTPPAPSVVVPPPAVPAKESVDVDVAVPDVAVPESEPEAADEPVTDDGLLANDDNNDLASVDPVDPEIETVPVPAPQSDAPVASDKPKPAEPVPNREVKAPEGLPRPLQRYTNLKDVLHLAVNSHDNKFTKNGWVNFSPNGLSSDADIRLYRAELRGSTILLFKAPASVDIRQFRIDPATAQDSNLMLLNSLKLSALLIQTLLRQLDTQTTLAPLLALVYSVQTTSETDLATTQAKETADDQLLVASVAGRTRKPPPLPLDQLVMQQNNSLFTTLNLAYQTLVMSPGLMAGDQHTLISLPNESEPRVTYALTRVPHPDLQLDADHNITQGLVEGIAHYILFEKDSGEAGERINQLIYLTPLFNQFGRFLKYFILLAKTFNRFDGHGGFADSDDAHTTASTEVAVPRRLAEGDRESVHSGEAAHGVPPSLADVPDGAPAVAGAATATSPPTTAATSADSDVQLQPLTPDEPENASSPNDAAAAAATSASAAAGAHAQVLPEDHAAKEKVMIRRLVLLVRNLSDSFYGIFLNQELFNLSMELLEIVLVFENVDQLKKLLVVRQHLLHQLSVGPLTSADAELNPLIELLLQQFLNLDLFTFVLQVNHIDLKFNNHWNQKLDKLLLILTNLANYDYFKRNLLIFNNNTHIHYLARLLVHHVLVEQLLFEQKAQILQKWIQLGCLLDKTGNMVLWLGIATIILLQPFLRLRNVWRHVEGLYVRILRHDWLPVVFELDRHILNNFKTLYHVIAPKGLGKHYSKKNVIPFFGDLIIYNDVFNIKKYDRNFKRIKYSFNRWSEFLRNMTDNSDTIALNHNILKLYLEANILLLDCDLDKLISLDVLLPEGAVAAAAAAAAASSSPHTAAAVAPSNQLLDLASISGAGAAEVYSEAPTTGDIARVDLRESYDRLEVVDEQGGFEDAALLLREDGSSPALSGALRMHFPHPQKEVAPVVDEHIQKLLYKLLEVNCDSVNLERVMELSLSTELGLEENYLLPVEPGTPGDPLSIKPLQRLPLFNNNYFLLTLPAVVPEAESLLRRKLWGDGAKGPGGVTTSQVLAPIPIGDKSATGLPVLGADAAPAAPAVLDTLVLDDELVFGVERSGIAPGTPGSPYAPPDPEASDAELSGSLPGDVLTQPLLSIKYASLTRLMDVLVLPHDILQMLIPGDATFESDEFRHVLLLNYTLFTLTNALIVALTNRFINAKNGAAYVGRKLALVGSEGGRVVDDAGGEADGAKELEGSGPVPPPLTPIVEKTPENGGESDGESAEAAALAPSTSLAIDWRAVPGGVLDGDNHLALRIQIRVLECLTILVDQFYDNFILDLKNKLLMIDLLKIVADQIDVWKDALKTAVGLETDLKSMLELCKLLKKGFIRKTYRPADVTKVDELLMTVLKFNNTLVEVPLNRNLPLYKNVGKIEKFLTKFNNFVKFFYDNIRLLDWFEVYKVFEVEFQNNSLLYFNLQRPNTPEDGLIILNVFLYLLTVYDRQKNELLLLRLPLIFRKLFKLYLKFMNYLLLQITDLSITVDERFQRMKTLLIMNLVARLKMLLYSVLTPGTGRIPLLVETALTNVIYLPELRYFSNFWLRAAELLGLLDGGAGLFEDLDLILPELLVELLQDRQEVFMPCFGWIVENLLRLNRVPNYDPLMRLINVGKRYLTYRFLQNFVPRVPLQSDMSAGFSDFEFLIRLLDHLINNKSLKDFNNFEQGQVKLFRKVIENQFAILKLDNAKLQAALAAAHAVMAAAAGGSAGTHPGTAGHSRHAGSVNGGANGSVNGTNGSSALTLRSSAQSLHSGSQLLSKSQRADPGGAKRQLMAYKLNPTLRFKISGFFNRNRPFLLNNMPFLLQALERVVQLLELPLANKFIDPKLKPTYVIHLRNKRIFPVYIAPLLFKIDQEGLGERFFFQAPTDTEMHDWLRKLDYANRHWYFLRTLNSRLNMSLVFGIPLEIVCNRENLVVPLVLEKIFLEIELEGLEELGIYRILPLINELQYLRAEVDRLGDYNFNSNRKIDVHTLSGCVKLYLREMPESLITDEVIKELFAVKGRTGDPEVRVQQYHDVLLKLPYLNYSLFKRLISHMFKIMGHEEANKMGSANLATVIGPALTEPSASDLVLGVGSINPIIDELIVNYERVFINM